MKYDYCDQKERMEKLGNLTEQVRTANRIQVANLTDRACRLGLPEEMSLTKFEDYIRGLYPEWYIARK